MKDEILVTFLWIYAGTPFSVSMQKYRHERTTETRNGIGERLGGRYGAVSLFRLLPTYFPWGAVWLNDFCITPPFGFCLTAAKSSSSSRAYPSTPSLSTKAVLETRLKSLSAVAIVSRILERCHRYRVGRPPQCLHYAPYWGWGGTRRGIWLALYVVIIVEQHRGAFTNSTWSGIVTG